MDRIIEVIVYLVSFVISIYGLSAIDINRFIKKNAVAQTYVLYLAISFIMAYLLGNMLLVLMGHIWYTLYGIFMNMHTLLAALPYFITPFLGSFILVPLVKKIGISIGVYAEENKRTVHSGKIVRMGGLAIFISFYVFMAIHVNADKVYNGLLIGGIIVFITGLIDDIYDISPKLKLLGQIIGAIVFLTTTDINIDFLNSLGWFSNVAIYFVAFVWIVGVTNAINLIDGLDGLSSGTTTIVLIVIGLLSYFMRRIDVSIMCLILCGAILGFLPYNFHPASIFVGDCGALFMGYMVSTISLLGFKTGTFIALLFPIIILFVPLSDTVLAILRRKAAGKSISEADRSHLHHVLMLKIGLSHRNTVLVLYSVSALFGTAAVLFFFNVRKGLIMLAILCVIAWMFIELTGMISPKFHPIIHLMRSLTGHPRKRKDAFFEANKPMVSEELFEDQQ